MAVLAFAHAWAPARIDAQNAARCFTDFAHSKFPMWLGCAMAAHENLAGGIIATAGALFAAWLAYSALQDQIGMARRNEQEAKRLEAEKSFEKSASDVDLMKLAFGYLQSIADEFPQPADQNLGREEPVKASPNKVLRNEEGSALRNWSY